MFQADPPTSTAAAIQPGVPGPGASRESDLTEDLSRYITQTRMAAKEGARIVVWQEGTLTVDPQHNPMAPRCHSSHGLLTSISWSVTAS